MVIVGAGPNGLSLAAHLQAQGVSFRIFGKPMESWLAQMPRDMLLKSEGFASSLYDPHRLLSLAHYCRKQGLPYRDVGLPVSLKTFCQYGLAFQQQAVPSLEHKLVTRIGKSDRGFTLELDDGEKFDTRRVVIAVGISHFSYVPPLLAGLPPGLASHSSAHVDVARFNGLTVAVVGGGASAIDIAALLHEAGADVRLLARRPALALNPRLKWPRTFWEALREPMSGLGPSWHSWFFSNLPLVFHRLPEARRLKWVESHLGPAGGWFMADRVVGRFPLMLGRTMVGARPKGAKVELETVTDDRKSERVEADHIIAATGYRPSIKRLPFIGPEIASRIETLHEAPILRSRFQSSVSGLYFVGPIAANSFGPVMRFAYAAKFTARHLSAHLAARAAQRPRDQRVPARLSFE